MEQPPQVVASSDFHHLSSQTGAGPGALLGGGAALDEQPAVGPSHLAFSQTPGVDAHTADDVLHTERRAAAETVDGKSKKAPFLSPDSGPTDSDRAAYLHKVAQLRGNDEDVRGQRQLAETLELLIIHVHLLHGWVQRVIAGKRRKHKEE